MTRIGGSHISPAAESLLFVDTLLSLLDSHARTRPQAAALLGVRRAALSYGGLAAQTRQAAFGLAGLGLRRNDRVAIVLPNGPEMAGSFLAASAIAASAPLNPAYSVEEFRFYLSDLRAKLMITAADAAPHATQAAEALGVPVVMLSGAVQAGTGLFELPPAAEGTVEFAHPEDVALVLHTSGTTAKPKIVPLTQRNLVRSARNIARALELTPQDRCLNIMPLFHVHGLIGALCSSLSAGGSVVCTPGFYAAEFWSWLAEFQPTWFTAVPTMHQSILSRTPAMDGTGRRHRLRFIRSCSSALAPKLMAEMETAFGVPVIEAYGMTEGSHQLASNPLPPRQRKAGSVGRAAGLEVAVMDEAGQLLPPGATGEIVARGENVTAGYERNAEANRKAFAGAWFRTGDQGHLDAEGYVFLTGRIKEIINRGGEKISPREIDEVLLDHPAVAQAVAFAVPDEKLGEEVGAVIVLRGGTNATEKEIRDHAAGRLAQFKVPSRVVFLKEIPKGPTGKLQRLNLAKLLGLGGEKRAPVARPPFIAPGNGVVTTLAGIWEQVLGIAPVGLNDHFQQLGGDSLSAARIASRIRQQLRVDLSIGELLGAPTLADQARVIEKEQNGTLAVAGDLARLLDEVNSISTEEARQLLSAQEPPHGDSEARP